MNKKILALLIVGVILLGGYVSYYAYATTVMMPEDLNTFKDELNSVSEPFINESDLKDLNNTINLIEKYDALSLMSQSQRNEMAENMTNGIQMDELEELKQNFTENRDRAQRYDLILKGDVAQEIRLTYDQEILIIGDELIANINKQASDIKKGDSKAYANDLREFINLNKELESLRQEAKGHLETIVTELGG
ncbi:hypothetical protein [Methanobacterium oryzae]|uniref:hypothetical protein n=1 Tax=Methanobacterium oryzae TaxID=69540 RepID=UPI003D1B157F